MRKLHPSPRGSCTHLHTREARIRKALYYDPELSVEGIMQQARTTDRHAYRIRKKMKKEGILEEPPNRYPQTVLDTKAARTRAALYYLDQTPIAAIREFLAHGGVHTTLDSIYQLRSGMCKQGILQKRGTTKKRAKTIAIEQIVREKPGAGMAAIVELARAQGITTSLGNVGKIRSRLKKSGVELPDLRKGRLPQPLPSLTRKEQALLERLIPYVRRYTYAEAKIRRWYSETRMDFEGECMAALPRWIRNHRPERRSMQGYIFMKVRYATKDYVRCRLQSELGLPNRKQAEKLVQIIRGYKQGSPLEAIAAEKGIPLPEARALWDAYRLLLSRQSFEQLVAQGRL